MNSLLGLLSDGLDIQSEKFKVKAINGYYKYPRLNDVDNAVMAALLVSNTNGGRRVVGGGILGGVSSADSYTQFSIPVTYLDNADELVFVMLSATLGTDLNSVSSLSLDNITIDYEELSDLSEVQSSSILRIYPNPIRDNVFRLNSSDIKNVKIFDVNGVLVK